MKRIITLLLCVVLTLGAVGCSFSVGNKGEDKDYKDIFTDKASELGKSYKTSLLTYDFTAGDYGKMKIYVDTSEGHSFEVDSEHGGFLLKDDEGEEVLHAYMLDPSTYEQVTAEVDDVRTINGRDFFVSDNDEKEVYHAFSYMADCGMDCGMILEAYEDPVLLRLVAFDGEPLENAKSDIYAYKGKAEAPAEVEEEKEAEAPADDTKADNSSEDVSKPETADEGTEAAGDGGTTNLLDDDAKNALMNLDSDYNNINWGVVYPADGEAQGLVISIAPYISYNQVNLLVAVTNLYDKPVSFSASAKALGEGDAVVGTGYVFGSAIGSGNTIVNTISCYDGMPDGRIKWEDGDISFETYQEYVPWEGDYEVSGNPSEGSLDISYQVYSATEEAIEPGMITIALLDENGNIMAVGSDYVDETVEAGEEYQGTIDIYEDKELLSRVSGAAMFVDSIK